MMCTFFRSRNRVFDVHSGNDKHIIKRYMFGDGKRNILYECGSVRKMCAITKRMLPREMQQNLLLLMHPRLLHMIAYRHNSFTFNLNSGPHTCWSLQQRKNSSTNTEKKTMKQIDRFNVHIKNHVHTFEPKMAEICPNNLLRVSKRSDALYLIDKNVAKTIVSLIIKDLSQNMCFVAEANPGIGLLTEELLHAGVPKVHMFEKVTEFHEVLKTLIQKYPGQLVLRRFQIFQFAKYVYNSTHLGTYILEHILAGVENKNWDDDACMQIIGGITNHRFIPSILMSTIFQNTLMANGRVAFYLMIPPSILNHYLNAKKYQKYNTSALMFHLLLDYKLLGVINRTTCVPLPSRKYLTKDDCGTQNPDNALYIVKLEPKRDLFTKYLEKKDLIPFWHFVRHTNAHRSRRIIPEMEKWIPGCGMRLISQDYNIFKQFNDLSPTEYLYLYKQFRAWPEYGECLFLPSVDAVLSGMSDNYITDVGRNYNFED